VAAGAEGEDVPARGAG